jgi:hypothetical protein
MIQNWIHRFEEGGGLRYLKHALAVLLVAILFIGYNLRGFRNMSNAEAMDAAQLARNIAENKGYTTLFIRPFSLFLVQRADAERNGPAPAGETQNRCLEMHPDLANPPVYPLLLAGLMKVQPKLKYQLAGSERIWNRGGNFWMYEPDFLIGIFNQSLFFAGVVIMFFLARRVFDLRVAWTSAGLFLGTDLFWRFSLSGLSTTLLMLVFLVLAWFLTSLEKSAGEGRTQRSLVLWAAAIGAVVGVGCLTRYSFGWIILPVLFFLILFLGRYRVILCITALAAFSLVIGPWLARNYRLSHTAFGVASYAICETTEVFPGDRLQRSLTPDVSISELLLSGIWQKFILNLQNCLRDDLPKLGGSWISAFFLVGLLVPFKNPALRRLRYFALLCLPVLIVAQCLGRTALSDANPVVNSENLLVLIAPLVIILGVGFFYILLDQMILPAPQLRYIIIAGFGLIICLPAILNLFALRATAIAWPPYLPPAIQTSANFMKEDELIMSDVPWAVSWYGRRQCIWLTLDTRNDFSAVSRIKPIKAVYLTPVTMDARPLSECADFGELGWGRFAIDSMMKQELPPNFPLRKAPAGYLPEQFFVTDVDRWSRPAATANIPSH